MGVATINKIEKIMEINEKGEFVRFFVVKYTSAKGMTGEVRVPEKEFSEDKIKELVASQAKQMDSLVGAEIKYE